MMERRRVHKIDADVSWTYRSGSNKLQTDLVRAEMIRETALFSLSCKIKQIFQSFSCIYFRKFQTHNLFIPLKIGYDFFNYFFLQRLWVHEIIIMTFLQSSYYKKNLSFTKWCFKMVKVLTKSRSGVITCVFP